MYLQNFKDNEDVASNYAGEHYGDSGKDAKDYQTILDELNTGAVHIAWYGYGSYEGSSFVLYTNADGQLKEVNGSHCSCFGLEGQWRPEDTTWEAIARLVEKGTKFCSEYGENNDADAEILRLVEEKTGRKIVRKTDRS